MNLFDEDDAIPAKPSPRKTRKTTKADASLPMSDDSIDFEASFGKIEGIVAALEGGDVPLEEALRLYEEAISHVRLCHRRLAQAEARIEVLRRVESDGSYQSEPLEELDDEEGGSPRRSTRG